MGFFTKLLRRDAAVLLAERGGQSALSFRYGGGAAAYGELIARWPELEVLAPFVDDPARLTNSVPEDRLPELLAVLGTLAAVPRLSVSVAEAPRAPETPAEAPAEAPVPAADEAPARPQFPSPEGLTGAQRERLSRLRAEVEAGRAPEVSLEDILLLFETLALEPGADNLGAMTALWRSYIGRYSALAGAPARWIWDYIQVREPDYPPAALLAALPGLPDPVIDAALTALERSGAPLRIPAWVLSRLSGYDIAASRFYQSFPDPAALEDLFSDAVAAVDAGLRAAEGRGLLDARCVARLRAQEVAAFRDIPGAADQRYTLYLRLYHRNPRLQTYLKLLLRCVENGLRARYRYSGRLQGERPDAETLAAVEGFLAQLPPLDRPGRRAAEAPQPRRKAPIALNMADVARLRADSDATRAALLAAVARDAWPEAADDGEETETPEPAPAGAEKEPADGGTASPWEAFFARADAEALRALMRGPDALRALAAARREMPDRLLDALNDAAADTLGDIIADGDGIFEEYADAIGARLNGG